MSREPGLSLVLTGGQKRHLGLATSHGNSADPLATSPNPSFPSPPRMGKRPRTLGAASGISQHRRRWALFGDQEVHLFPGVVHGFNYVHQTWAEPLAQSTHLDIPARSMKSSGIKKDNQAVSYAGLGKRRPLCLTAGDAATEHRPSPLLSARISHV